MDSERREAYPGALFTQEELDENAKWSKAHNEFDALNFETRSQDVVLEHIAVKLDALIRATMSIKRAIRILVFIAVLFAIIALLH